MSILGSGAVNEGVTDGDALDVDADAEAAEASGGAAAAADFPFVEKVLGVASMEPNDCTGREPSWPGVVR